MTDLDTVSVFTRFQVVGVLERKVQRRQRFLSPWTQPKAGLKCTELRC